MSTLPKVSAATIPLDAIFDEQNPVTRQKQIEDTARVARAVSAQQAAERDDSRDRDVAYLEGEEARLKKEIETLEKRLAGARDDLEATQTLIKETLKGFQK